MQTAPFPTDRQHLINDLYARGVAGLAALASIRRRVEDGDLRTLLDDYIGVSKAQMRRVHALANETATPLTAPDGAEPIEGLRQVARELAHGLLTQRVDAAAARILHRLASAKLELYRDGGRWFAKESDAVAHEQAGSVRAVMLSGEAEELGFLDCLIAHTPGPARFGRTA